MAARKGKRTNADDLPLDDRRWLALKTAHHIISEQLTGAQLSPIASFDLIEGLQSGKLRCMRRSLINPSERELVPASFWQGLRIDVEVDCIRILPGVPIGGPARFSEDLCLGLLCLGAGHRKALAINSSRSEVDGDVAAPAAGENT